MAELVAVDLRPGPEFLDALGRAWESGDAVLPLQREAPLGHRLEVARRLGAGIHVDETGSRRTDWGRPVEEGDAVVIATSGTTGEPKGVVHTHDSIEASAYMTATALGVDDDVHWLCCLPLSHVAGLSVVTRALRTGAGLTVHGSFDPAAVDRAARSGATHVSLVPTTLRRVEPLLWRRILLGGSAIPADRPPNTVAGYGMSETWGGVVYEGQALPGVSMRIAGREWADRTDPGPIELRTPSAMRAYRDGTDPFDSDGWFTTGDLGWIDPGDGRLHVAGRSDDLIITGGEKVWPTPVEQALEAHPDVAQAGVVGVADHEWGQRVRAVVVAAEGRSAPGLEELREWVGSTLPRSAAPRELLVVDDLPRTALGKLRRSSLVDAGGGRGSGGASGGR